MEIKTGEALAESGKLGELYLEHYGIKGMKWGQRRKRGANGRVSTEAKRKEAIEKKVKSKGIKSLTNKELGDYNKRLNLEQQYTKLSPEKKSVIKSGAKFVNVTLAVATTANRAYQLANSPLAKKISQQLKR